jgi:thiol-disulfide isomerase/thioredoxin
MHDIMSKKIICEIESRKAFMHLLEHNTGLIILKLGATWCGPCLKIEKPVNDFFATSPEDVICGIIDVDESFDFYAFLKAKKMVNGIPAMLCYKKGNATFIPDDSLTGSDLTALDAFFKRCNGHLCNVRIRFPGSQVTPRVS